MAGKGGDTSSALGLLLLRIGTCGLLIYGHGWPKLVHFSGGEPLKERELAILYAIPFAAIALLGPGRFSIDGARGNA